MHWENWKGYLAIVLALVLLWGMIVCVPREITKINRVLCTAYRAYPPFGTTTRCARCGCTKIAHRVYWSNPDHTIMAVCTECLSRVTEQTLDAPKEEKHVTR
jgi:hypothetical protein